MPLRLRHNDKSIVLQSGQLLVGRGSDCHLVVSDPLVSRRHAVIAVGQTGAFVTDLESKAGVLVNGLLISGARRLAVGDTIQIASTRIVIESFESNEEEPTDPRLRTTVSPPALAAPQQAFRIATPPLGIPRIEPAWDPRETQSNEARASAAGGARPPPSRATETLDDDDLARTMEAPRARVADGARRSAIPESSRGPFIPEVARRADVPEVARRASNLRALGIAAEKALALGRAEEAERILQRPLMDALDAARRGDLDADTLEVAATFAARLAATLAAGRWFDHAVNLYSVRRELMPAPVVDQLLGAARKAKPIDKAAFRKYLADARVLAGESPARRFVIQRLEGVQRLLDLR